MSPTPLCQCGKEEESTTHYLCECPVFQNQRAKLHTEITKYVPEEQISANLLLEGDPQLSTQTNIDIIKASMDYIKATNRFAKKEEPEGETLETVPD